MYNIAVAAGTPWLAKQTFAYLHNTSTSGLHNHIDEFHSTQYTELALIHGWLNLLPSFRKAQAAQKKELAAAHMLAATGQVPFTPNGLLQHLVDFIVVNNQVGFNLL